MVLTKSNKLGDDIYRKEVFYIDSKSLNDDLYSESVEFRSCLSRDLSRKVLDGLDSLFENGNGEKNGKMKRRSMNNGKNGGLLKNGLKVKKPVVSFFTDKARVLKEEIEKINHELEERKLLEKEFQESIHEDKKEVKRLLYEVSFYSPGTKHSIDLRRLDLERSMLNLRRELRLSKLSMWRDLVSLRRELREIVFEYQALKRMSELVEN